MNMLYKQIEKAIREHQSNLVVSNETTKTDVYKCVNSIMRDNPDIFWFSQQLKFIKKKHEILFYYTFNKTNYEKAKKQIEDVIQNDFCLNEVIGLSQTQQVMYVYKWISLYCNYNIYSAYNQSIYSVFVCRNSVCEGYSKAAQYLLGLLGIKSRLVTGFLRNAEKGIRHCWLLVNINNLWYHFDPSLAGSENRFILQRIGITPNIGADGLYYNFFCCDTITILKSRMIEENEEDHLPICSSSINFKKLHNIKVRIFRTDEKEKLGAKGCLLNDSGSTSSVYLWHSEDKTQKVVKKLKQGVPVSLIKHEFEIMEKLSFSPSIIHCYGLTEDQDGIVMEQATPLKDLLCCQYFKLSAVDYCRLLLDVISGLEDCLHLGIYYSDIHLNNIYLKSNGHYVLGDFGSCKMLNNNRFRLSRNYVSIWYAAPEIIRYNSFDETSITYEVGMLAYFILNELCPPLWHEYGSLSAIERIYGRDITLPFHLKTPSCDFELQLAKVIMKSLSLNPCDRYQSLSDLKSAIIKCLHLAENSDYLFLEGGYFDIFNANGSSYDPELIAIGSFNASMCSSFNELITYYPSCQHSDNNPQEAKDSSIWSKLGKVFRRDRNDYIREDVYSSVFAPSEVKSNSNMLIQVYLHHSNDAEKVASLAIESSKNTKRRDFIPLHTNLRIGDIVKVELNVYGNETNLLHNDQKTIRWSGEISKCTYRYFVPADIDFNELYCEMNVYVNSVPIGEMCFITEIVEDPINLNTEIKSRVYNHIFISYSKYDLKRVENFAIAYRALGVDYFFDRHTLSPGDVYEKVIFEYIDSADLFLLFWSKNAAESKFVKIEYERALKCYESNVNHMKMISEQNPFYFMRRKTELPDMKKPRIYPIVIHPKAELPDVIKNKFHYIEI